MWLILGFDVFQSLLCSSLVSSTEYQLVYDVAHASVTWVSRLSLLVLCSPVNEAIPMLLDSCPRAIVAFCKVRQRKFHRRENSVRTANF